MITIKKLPKEINPEKIFQDIIGDETWSQLQGLMFDHHLDLQGISRHLVDCHRLLEKEDTHEKLASRDSIEEIRNHIEKLKPLRKIEKKHVVEVLPTVDISSPISEDQNHTDDTIEKQDWLICPICWRGIPILVKDPSQKPERGFVFKEVDGNMVHRFIGVTDKYLPLEIYKNGDVVVEKSSPISFLKRTDVELYNHIREKLDWALRQFSRV